jgi:hypothetical protein
MTRWTRFTGLGFCLIDSGGMRQCLAKEELTVHGQVHRSHAKAQPPRNYLRQDLQDSQD